MKCRCGRVIDEEEVRAGFKICGICQEEFGYTDKEAKELW